MSAPVKSVFFIDIATFAGWCEGPIGGKPVFGSLRLAPEGSDSPAVAFGLFKFLATRFQAFKPNLFVYESPRDPRHMKKTSANAIRTLIGLPMVAEAAAYGSGIWDIREAEAASIRSFILPPRPKGSGRRDNGELKRDVFNEIRARGYDAKNTDETDAIAGWLYACSILDQRVGVRTTPLFSGLGGE